MKKIRQVKIQDFKKLKLMSNNNFEEMSLFDHIYVKRSLA